jgi:hypothetical protein
LDEAYSGRRMFGYRDETEQPESQRKPGPGQKPIAAQELLIWIRRYWNKPTISLRDIMIFAPRAIRDREIATKHAETLEKCGWLAPIRSHRRDRRVWRLPPAGATALPD